MAGSVVEICNRALDLLGAGPIVSLDDDTQAARLCARNYGPSRDAVLRLYPWNDAAGRAALAADAEPPPFEFSASYTLPNDCLRVIAVFGALDYAAPWRVEGGKVLCSLGAPLLIRYTRRLTDPGLIGPMLAEGISAHLAAAIAFGVTNSNSMAGEMKALRDAVIREARQIDAIEQSQDEQVRADAWTGARFSAYGQQTGTAESGRGIAVPTGPGSGWVWG